MQRADETRAQHAAAADDWVAQQQGLQQQVTDTKTELAAAKQAQAAQQDQLQKMAARCAATQLFGCSARSRFAPDLQTRTSATSSPWIARSTAVLIASPHHTTMLRSLCNYKSSGQAGANAGRIPTSG